MTGADEETQQEEEQSEDTTDDEVDYYHVVHEPTLLDLEHTCRGHKEQCKSQLYGTPAHVYTHSHVHIHTHTCTSHTLRTHKPLTYVHHTHIQYTLHTHLPVSIIDMGTANAKPSHENIITAKGQQRYSQHCNKSPCKREENRKGGGDHDRLRVEVTAI